MILSEFENEVKHKLRTLESIDVDEGAYEMWKKQTLTQIMFGNLELAYYMHLRNEESVDWMATIEQMLTRAPKNVTRAEKS